MALTYWTIQRAIGGFSDGSRSGPRDSYRYGEFIDYKTDPDSLAVLNAATDDSSSTYSALPLWCETNGSRVFIYDKAGNLYERTAANTHTLLRAVSSSKGQGLAIFNGVLYYALTAALGSYNLTTLAFNDSAQTLTSNERYHPLKSFLNLLVVGNGQYVATLDDSGVWNATRLSLQPNEEVRCLEVWDSYIAIGTQFFGSSSAVPRGNIYLWDGTSQFSNEVIPTTGAVQALCSDNGTLICFIGAQADMYAFTGGRPVKIKEIPRVNNGNIEVLPGAVSPWRNQIRFGTAAGTSNTAPKGIYTYGSSEDSIPKSLSFDFAPSNDVYTGAGVSIGFFKQLSATQALFSWEYNGTYKVDRITTESYATEAVYESLIFDNQRPFLMRRPIQIRVTLDEVLAEDEYVKVYLKKQGESTFTRVGTTASTDEGKSAFTFFCDKDLDTSLIYSPRGFQHELKLVWGGTGSTRPTIESCTVLLEEETDISVNSD
jgi:hypothetical protein